MVNGNLEQLAPTVEAYFVYARTAVEEFRANPNNQVSFDVPPIIPDVTIDKRFKWRTVGEGSYSPERYTKEPGIEFPSRKSIKGINGVSYTGQLGPGVLEIISFDLTLDDGFGTMIVANGRVLFSNFRRRKIEDKRSVQKIELPAELTDTGIKVRALLSEFFIVRRNMRRFTEADVIDANLEGNSNLKIPGFTMHQVLRDGLTELATFRYVEEISPGVWARTEGFERWILSHYRRS